MEHCKYKTINIQQSANPITLLTSQGTSRQDSIVLAGKRDPREANDPSDSKHSEDFCPTNLGKKGVITTKLKSVGDN